MPSPIPATGEEPEEAIVQADIYEAAMEGGDVPMADVSQEEYSEADRARLGTKNT